MKTKKTQRQIEREYIDEQLRQQQEAIKKKEEFDALPVDQKIDYYLRVIRELKQDGKPDKMLINAMLSELRKIKDDHIEPHKYATKSNLPQKTFI